VTACVSAERGIEVLIGWTLGAWLGDVVHPGDRRESRPNERAVRQCVVTRSRRYRLEAEGELSDQLEPLFEGMSLTRDRGNTVFRGRVQDQGELFGLLQRFADLGPTLVSVDSVDHDAEH
jgi:hypothetical protein